MLVLEGRRWKLEKNAETFELASIGFLMANSCWW
jgi:hypothetical protein